MLLLAAIAGAVVCAASPVDEGPAPVDEEEHPEPSASGSAQAAALRTYRLTLVGGLGGLLGPPSVGGYGVGRAVLDLGGAGLDLAGREGYAGGPARTLGSIFVGGRVGERMYARGGFAHHHETPWDVFLAAPGASLAGTGEGITHRSGLELGAGVDLTVLGPVFDERVGFVLDLSVAVLPDAKGPRAYVLLEQAWSIDVLR